MKKALLALAFALAVSPALAIDTGKAFDDPELQARYEKIIDEVRCLKCQNQTIKDSNAFLASDLGLLRAFDDGGKRLTPKQLTAKAEAWRPWRAYAALLLWSSSPGSGG